MKKTLSIIKPEEQSEVATTQSSGFYGQRFYVFVFTVLALNFTMFFATRIHADLQLALVVVEWTCFVSIALILGRSGVHLAEVWSTRTKLVESSTTQTTIKKREKP